MSASNEWFEYHLTVRGWINGSEKLDVVGIKEKQLPHDRVLTLRFHDYLSSSFSGMDRWYEEQFRSEDDYLVNELLNKFGEIPEYCKHYNYYKR